MNSENNNSQRHTAYRAVIPFYILYDLDLNANHYRLYGQIEQMESNPNPNIHPTFSMAWIAEQLGINKRNANKMAALLVKKGYITHTEVSPGVWVWQTAKKSITINDNNCTKSIPKGCLPETGGDVSQRQGGDVSQRQGGDVSQRHPKIPKDKIPKELNKTSIVSLKNSFEKIKKTNPHNISDELLEEWQGIRKKPITERVWNRTNQVMSELTHKGLPAIDAFELMLEKQWQSMEVHYFEQEIAKRNGIATPRSKGNGSDALSRVINKYLKPQGNVYDHFAPA